MRELKTTVPSGINLNIADIPVIVDELAGHHDKDVVVQPI